MSLTEKDRSFMMALAYEAASFPLVGIGTVIITLATDGVTTTLGATITLIGMWGNWTFRKERKRFSK